MSNYYELKISDIMGKSRLSNLVRGRQIAMYLMRELMGLSFPSIGKSFNRDHTTAMYAFNKIKKEISQKENKEIGKIKNLSKN